MKKEEPFQSENFTNKILVFSCSFYLMKVKTQEDQ